MHLKGLFGAAVARAHTNMHTSPHARTSTYHVSSYAHTRRHARAPASTHERAPAPTSARARANAHSMHTRMCARTADAGAEAQTLAQH
eukprot:4031015-Alexandrium_andersonii.AAC.1